MSDTRLETSPAPSAPPKRKLRRWRRLLILAMPILLVAAAGGGVAKFFPGLWDRAETLVGLHAKPTAVAQSYPQYVALPEMAVTLPNAGHPRQMRIKIAVELVPNAPADATAEILSPRVYDALLTYLRTLRDGEVDSGLGLDRLRGDLYRRLDLVLGPGILRDVLITSLVLA